MAKYLRFERIGDRLTDGGSAMMVPVQVTKEWVQYPDGKRFITVRVRELSWPLYPPPPTPEPWSSCAHPDSRKRALADGRIYVPEYTYLPIGDVVPAAVREGNRTEAFWARFGCPEWHGDWEMWDLTMQDSELGW